MDISNIYVHDGRLLRVIEDVERDTLTMEVELPLSPDSDDLVPRLLVFEDVHGYQVFDGPFQAFLPFWRCRLSVRRADGGASELTPTQETENYFAQESEFLSTTRSNFAVFIFVASGRRATDQRRWASAE